MKARQTVQGDPKKDSDAEHPAAATFVSAVARKDVAGAVAALTVMAGECEADPEYCIPFQVGATWEESVWQENLQVARKHLTGLCRRGPDSRAPRIAGFHNATGMGKTHGLLVAGKLLGAERSLYLTYNLDQDLSFDRANPRVAVLLRVFLRSIGISNTKMSSRVFRADILKTLDVEDVLECVAVHLAGTVASKTASDALDTTDIFIGLDEIRKLLDDASTTQACFGSGVDSGPARSPSPRKGRQLHGRRVRAHPKFVPDAV